MFIKCYDQKHYIDVDFISCLKIRETETPNRLDLVAYLSRPERE